MGRRRRIGLVQAQRLFQTARGSRMEETCVELYAILLAATVSALVAAPTAALRGGAAAVPLNVGQETTDAKFSGSGSFGGGSTAPTSARPVSPQPDVCAGGGAHPWACRARDGRATRGASRPRLAARPGRPSSHAGRRHSACGDRGQPPRLLRQRPHAALPGRRGPRPAEVAPGRSTGQHRSCCPAVATLEPPGSVPTLDHSRDRPSTTTRPTPGDDAHDHADLEPGRHAPHRQAHQRHRHLYVRDSRRRPGPRRPMSNNGNVEYDGDSWFFSYRDTPKVQEIEADPAVELAYVATEKGTWVSIEGTAEIVEDDAKKKELWEKSLEQWFKTGPEDDEVILLKVSAKRVHRVGRGRGARRRPGQRPRGRRVRGALSQVRSPDRSAPTVRPEGPGPRRPRSAGVRAPRTGTPSATRSRAPGLRSRSPSAGR